jgi:hypothetical protein
MARTSEKLVAEKGIMSSPNVKPGKVLPPATMEMLKQFYMSDEISTNMPGTKYYVSVNSKGKKVHLQKLLILCNLKEAYLTLCVLLSHIRDSSCILCRPTVAYT